MASQNKNAARTGMRLRLLAAAACLVRRADAGSCMSYATTAQIDGYDMSSRVEANINYEASPSSFSVTGVVCASGYVGTPVASSCPVDATTSKYVLSGCEACTSGVGLCPATAETPAQPVGSQIYFQDTGTSSSKILWNEPHKGTYNAPILGYKLQMKQLCLADVAGTLVKDADNNNLDYADAYYDCAATYSTGFTEPVAATATSTTLGTWVDVTGVYTPTSGQNHDANCAAACATTACSGIGNDAAILDTTTGCSGCMPQNPATDVGCFPGAAGYPTTVATSHAIGGLTSDKYYVFRVAAFNHFGTGAWSTESYAVHTHSLRPRRPGRRRP
jgi:hypothetical protein